MLYAKRLNAQEIRALLSSIRESNPSNNVGGALGSALPGVLVDRVISCSVFSTGSAVLLAAIVALWLSQPRVEDAGQ